VRPRSARVSPVHHAPTRASCACPIHHAPARALCARPRSLQLACPPACAPARLRVLSVVWPSSPRPTAPARPTAPGYPRTLHRGIGHGIFTKKPTQEVCPKREINPPKTFSQSRKSVYRAEGTAVPQPIYLQTSFHVHKI